MTTVLILNPGNGIHRQLSPLLSLSQFPNRRSLLSISISSDLISHLGFRILVMAASPEKDKEQNTMEEKQERRQLSPIDPLKRRLSPENEKRRRLSPENEKRRRLYVDRFFNLKRRYRDFVARIKSCKVLLSEKRITLRIIREERRVITINWKETSSLCNELKVDFPLFARDLRKCLESNLEDSKILEYIPKQDNHQSEEAELMLAEIKDLHTKTLQLSLKEMGAECFVGKLSTFIRILEDEYNKLLVKISSLHTKPESEEDSRARSPPDSPESRMLKKRLKTGLENQFQQAGEGPAVDEADEDLVD